MKYILMMEFGLAQWKEGNMSTWAPEDIKANNDFLRRFHKDLTNAGELVETHGLGGPEQMRLVQARKDGTHTVTDGPFPEAKEFLAGFWIVDVESSQRAYEIAARLSTLPGRGGAPANIPIVVRPVMEDRGAEI
jgi:hypothetical protein